MKQTRKLYFELLEKRELLASDFGHSEHLQRQHEIDRPLSVEFRLEKDFGNESRSMFDRKMHSHSAQGRDFLPTRPISTSFVTPIVSVGIPVTSLRSQQSRAEGEAGSTSRVTSIVPTLPAQRAISIIILTDRLFSIPTTIEIATPRAQGGSSLVSMRSLTTIQDTSDRGTSPRALEVLAPDIKLLDTETIQASPNAIFHMSSARQSYDAIFKSALATCDFDENTSIAEIANAAGVNVNTELGSPVPEGMIHLGLDSRLNSHFRSIDRSKHVRKSTGDGLEARIHSRIAFDHQAAPKQHASVQNKLPIPAGMIYLDFAASSDSQSDSKLAPLPKMLQAGFSPLALIQAFVTAEPTATRVPNQAVNTNESVQADTNEANTISWTTVGIAGALSGLFFVLKPHRKVKKVEVIPNQKSNRSLRS